MRTAPQTRRKIWLADPLLAVFVAVDIVTFWSQAWVTFRFASHTMAVLVIGLVVSAVLYVAASVTLPGRDPVVDRSIDLETISGPIGAPFFSAS